MTLLHSFSVSLRQLNHHEAKWLKGPKHRQGFHKKLRMNSELLKTVWVLPTKPLAHISVLSAVPADGMQQMVLLNIVHHTPLHPDDIMVLNPLTYVLWLIIYLIYVGSGCLPKFYLQHQSENTNCIYFYELDEKTRNQILYNNKGYRVRML